MGMVMSHAYHEPDKLEKLLAPPVEESLKEAVRDDSLWEDDQWWKSAATT